MGSRSRRANRTPGGGRAVRPRHFGSSWGGGIPLVYAPPPIPASPRTSHRPHKRRERRDRALSRNAQRAAAERPNLSAAGKGDTGMATSTPGPEQDSRDHDLEAY